MELVMENDFIQAANSEEPHVVDMQGFEVMDGPQFGEYGAANLKSGDRMHVSFEGRNYRIKVWADCVDLTDITDAGRRGKKCASAYFEHKKRRPMGGLTIWVDDLRACLVYLRENWKGQKVSGLREEFEGSDLVLRALEVREQNRVFNSMDLSVYRPLEKAPKKWTMPHAIRGLVNGQLVWVHTHKTGETVESLDVTELVRDLIEKPGLDTVRVDDDGMICLNNFMGNHRFRLGL